MGMDSIATQRQPAPTGNGADITDLVMHDLADRREAGIKKYGTSLRAFNGRNALIDAYQESLDQCLYLRQRIEEEGGYSMKGGD